MEEKIKVLTINDKNYPKILKKIKNPPKKLYYKGKILTEEKCFAIVGTRKYSIYGKQAALEIANDLSEAGLTIVSGLAPGIDTFAHRAAIEQGKRTIAVLGTGIDEKSVYPKENIGLSREIIERGGAVLSEYPPGTRGTRFTFPRRNRIISGLSLGVLVIEAKEKSGSLITANYALKQNRKIFAVPGSIYSKNSSGPHFLIKNGAVLVENSNDILKEINLKPPVSDPKKDIKKSGGKTENETEKIVLSTLEGEALYIDKIIEKTKIPAAKIAGVLAILEIKGKVKNLGGNVYALRR